MRSSSTTSRQVATDRRVARSLPKNFRIDTDTYVPYYQQIVEHVRALIRSRSVREGDPFHSEGEIARLLGISKMPVRQAYLKLRTEGLLVVEKGRRPVIGSRRVPWNFQELRGFTEEMKRRGLEPSAKLLGLTRAAADVEVASALHLDVGAPIFTMRRLRFVDQEPVALVISHLPAAIFADLDRKNLQTASLYRLIEKTYGHRLGWAEEEIGAVNASAAVARALGAKPGSALLFVRETTYDVGGIAIEYSHSLLRADRYTATVVSVRKKS